MSAGDQASKDAVEGNVMSAVDELRREVAALRAQVLELDRLDSATENVGSVTQIDLEIKDDEERIRLRLSGRDLYDDLKVHAYLAALSQYGYPTAWMDADTGDIVAAGGNALMADRGFEANQIPFLFTDDFDSPYRKEHILYMDSAPQSARFYNILFELDTLGSNLIGGGDFETGWEAYWDERPASGEIVEHEDGYALKIIDNEEAWQEVALDVGDLYLLEIDVYGDAFIQIVSNVSNWALYHVNSYSAWTKVSIPIKGRAIEVGHPFYLILSGNPAQFDNVSIRKIIYPVGFVHELESNPPSVR
jgi:hypothetical protein